MPFSHSSLNLLSEQLADIAWKAGQLLCFYRSQINHADYKEDGTPVTLADKKSEEFILKELSSQFPKISIVSEESADIRSIDDYFFLVDPLDGTRDYLRPQGEYTVNIALIHQSRPIAATIVAPEEKTLWIAGETARKSSIKNPVSDSKIWSSIHCRKVPEEGGIALTSRNRKDDIAEKLMAQLPVYERKAASSAIKFGWIAEGKADIYIRSRPTMEWDIAAGDLILLKAGGGLYNDQGEAYHYGVRKSFLNGTFVALGDPSLTSKILLRKSLY